MLKFQNKVACSGNQESKDKHPKVFLKIELQKAVSCPYCSKTFMLIMKNNRAFLEIYSRPLGG